MTSSRIRIHYFTDVLCVWAYLAQVRLDELIKNNSSDIEISYHFMPIFGNTEHRIGEGWKDKGGYAAFSQHTHKVCAAYPYLELHKDIWQVNQPKTSAISHLMIKAVQCLVDEGVVNNEADSSLQHRTQFEEFVWQVRLAFFRDAKDIGNMQVLMGIARAMQLPLAEIQRVLDDGTALAAVCRDIELRDGFRVEGSPTYILNEGRQKLYGNVGYRIIEANLHEILKQPKMEASWC
ncbi:MAG TPA: disulfide bond formation protein DsbA [Methyloprofundus sp.]|uniref:DsbA family oxidoreductase n=1 Tax=Methyloprofundus sp. TaxID=2020875 RepID=UPI00178EF6BF|nr:DsbA family protein [Methyloprofundus sp.]HIG65594.1 disulfide bond formation protein DsbA [Methyloprofundus sp.]HIL78956.1 disulfide bond formation protein DsbA [Methylococcales bacterium]